MLKAGIVAVSLVFVPITPDDEERVPDIQKLIPVLEKGIHFSDGLREYNVFADRTGLYVTYLGSFCQCEVLYLDANFDGTMDDYRIVMSDDRDKRPRVSQSDFNFSLRAITKYLFGDEVWQPLPMPR